MSISHFPGNDIESPKKSGKTRRWFLRSSLVTALSAAGLAVRAHNNAQQVEFRSLSLPDSLRVPGLEGLNVLYQTDHHIGGSINGIVSQVLTGTQTLLASATPDTCIVLHGGDFVNSDTSFGPETALEDIRTYTPQLFSGLSQFPNFAVIGNHDEDNTHFFHMKAELEKQHGICFLEHPHHRQDRVFRGIPYTIHGLHTLGDYLKRLPETERNTFLDEYITEFTTGKQQFNIVLMHNPDGLEFLLRRLKETNKKLTIPTLFLAGHTHGAMFDVVALRTVGLRMCNTQFGRYKGWYGPQGEYVDTGRWQMYVSTGIGNSKGTEYRLNADPEVVMFTL